MSVRPAVIDLETFTARDDELVGFEAQSMEHGGMILVQLLMRVPFAVTAQVDQHEPATALGQPPGGKTALAGIEPKLCFLLPRAVTGIALLLQDGFHVTEINRPYCLRGEVPHSKWRQATVGALRIRVLLKENG